MPFSPPGRSTLCHKGFGQGLAYEASWFVSTPDLLRSSVSLRMAELVSAKPGLSGTRCGSPQLGSPSAHQASPPSPRRRGMVFRKSNPVFGRRGRLLPSVGEGQRTDASGELLMCPHLRSPPNCNRATKHPRSRTYARRPQRVQIHPHLPATGTESTTVCCGMRQPGGLGVAPAWARVEIAIGIPMACYPRQKTRRSRDACVSY